MKKSFDINYREKSQQRENDLYVVNNFQKTNNFLRASATIEAAFLIPISLSLILLIIQFSTFLYNREAIAKIAYICAIHGVQMEHESAGKITSEIKKELETEIQGKLIFSPEVITDVKVSLLSVNVQIEMKQAIMGQNFLKLIGWRQSFSSKVSRKEIRVNPAEIIWESRRAKSLMKK